MNIKGAQRMEMVLVFVFIVGLAFLGFVGIQDRMKEKDPNKSNSNSNQVSNEKKEKELIGNYSTIKLYITDYVYSGKINGYNYTEVSLSNVDLNSIKEELSKLDLNDTIDDIVYGQYKLVLDDKVIYYDANTESAMYNNKIFKFPKNIKIKLNITNNTCSCCTTTNCNINLCKCN